MMVAAGHATTQLHLAPRLPQLKRRCTQLAQLSIWQTVCFFVAILQGAHPLLCLCCEVHLRPAALQAVDHVHSKIALAHNQ